MISIILLGLNIHIVFIDDENVMNSLSLDAMTQIGIESFKLTPMRTLFIGIDEK